MLKCVLNIILCASFVLMIVIGNLIYFEVTSFKRVECGDVNITNFSYNVCETFPDSGSCTFKYNYVTYYVAPACTDNQPGYCCGPKIPNYGPRYYNKCNISDIYKVDFSTSNQKRATSFVNTNSTVTCWTDSKVIKINQETKFYVVGIIILSILLFIQTSSYVLVCIYMKHSKKNNMLFTTEIELY
jgi:hypothetical protein